MIDDILDCLEDEYKYKDTEYLFKMITYLANLDKKSLVYARNRCYARLKDANRCPFCGTEMEIHEYREYHNELDGCPYETMREPYCPNGCGV